MMKRILTVSFFLLSFLIAVLLTNKNAIKQIYAQVTFDTPVTFSGSNSVSAPQFIDTASSSYYLDPAATGNSLLVAGNIGIGTTTPAQKLDVVGTVKATAFSGDGSGLTGVGGVPAGTVVFYNGASCPSGWTEVTGARGRVIVGLPASGTLAGTVGTALTNLEDRTHSHSTPAHTHKLNSTIQTEWSLGVNVGGSDYASKEMWGAGYGGTPNSARALTNTSGSGTSGTASTSQVIPYIQLLVCQKS